ncbi:hypothetical protein Fmac_009635 [Flemingia macrophylla]|uniref:Uncharacterized protein n=1 Tax=Flemingia macrophylla TaxID=520843 RepID=A0ABD1N0T3_9FABA
MKDAKEQLCEATRNLVKILSNSLKLKRRRTVTPPASILGLNNAGASLMNKIAFRMKNFARLMGVPFNFNVVHHQGKFSDFDFNELNIRDDEALEINCVNTLH